MPLTIETIKVGMHVMCNWQAPTLAGYNRYGKTAIVQEIHPYGATVIVWDDGLRNSTRWSHPKHFDEIISGRKPKLRKPKKVIPDIPLDPTLPILEAGYLQDRLRKKFR